MNQIRRSILNRLLLLNIAGLSVVALGLVLYGLVSANRTEERISAQLLPMVTVAGYSLGFLFAGSALVESVFGWPGMGLLLVDAIHQQNNMVVLGVVIVLTVTIIIVNILTDIVYGLVDARLRVRFARKPSVSVPNAEVPT